MRGTIQLAFGSAILILLAVGAISYRSIAVSRESERWVFHTHEILENIDELLLAMEDVRTGYRGYALTGEEPSLASYHANVTLAEQKAETIRSLTVDNPVQQRRIPDLESLIAQRIQFGEMVINLRRTKGPEAAADAMRTGLAERGPAGFRKLTRDMRAEELRLLALRVADAELRSGETGNALLLGSLLGLLIVATAGWHVQRESSRRVLAEQALREKQFRLLLDAAPDAMVGVNQAGEVASLNLHAEKQFGYSRNELLGQQIKKIIPEGFPERLIAGGAGSAAGALPRQISEGIELSGRRKDGTEFPAEITLSPLENTGGILVIAAIRDISVRKAAEGALRQSEERLRLIFSNMRDYAILMLDLDGRIVSWSEGAERIEGYRAEEIIGQHFSRFYLAEDISNGKLALKLAEARRNGSVEDEGWRVRKDGSRFYANDVITALHDETGLLRGFGKITRDITERKKSEAGLAKTVEELKRSNDQLEQFAYVASHDLQEPLRMVASYTQLLAKRYQGRLDPDADEFIAYAVDGCNRMQGLILDLLAYSRAGSQSNALRTISSEDALNQAIENLRAAIEESGAIVTHDSLPVVVSDDMQLAQVFQNLIGNAIKYRAAAAPLVHLSATQNGGKEWIFSVRDNGLGIAPQYFERIFILFQRLHSRDEFKGTGIGLSVCKKVVERLGGRIWVESQLGKGSAFYFSLPDGETDC